MICLYTIVITIHLIIYFVIVVAVWLLIIFYNICYVYLLFYTFDLWDRLKIKLQKLLPDRPGLLSLPPPNDLPDRPGLLSWRGTPPHTAVLLAEMRSAVNHHPSPSRQNLEIQKTVNVLIFIFLSLQVLKGNTLKSTDYLSLDLMVILNLTWPYHWDGKSHFFTQ